MSLSGGAERTEPLRALFSRVAYPGGKADIADLVWRRFGNVDNYCEPFMGTAAVLLRRPAEHFADRYRVETTNDQNHYLVNLHRALIRDPEKVAEYADQPVFEADLHARHAWLVRSREAVEWRERMAVDPDCYDAKIAGWWVWGQCAWIGTGWCEKGMQFDRLPELSQECQTGGRGVNGVHRSPNTRPQLTDKYDIGRGVLGGATAELQKRRPDLCPGDGGIGHGVHAHPAAGTCDARRAWLVGWMRRLQDRLRLVRTCYGHWARICDSKSTLTRLGVTGVFLDSPYALSVQRMHAWVAHMLDGGPIPPPRKGKAERAAKLYATDTGTDVDYLVAEVHVWCRKWGGDPNIRICVAGYEGEHNPLEQLGWEKVAWAANGGYANQSGKKNENASRERLWFNKNCIRTQDRGLFDDFE